MNDSTLRAVLLDLYGTLAVIPSESYRSAKLGMADALGCEPQAFQEAWRSLSTMSTRGELRSTTDRVRATLAIIGGKSEPSAIEAAAAIEQELQESAVRLLPGAIDCLSRLQSTGAPLALVTNCSSAAARVPELLGIRPYFKTTVLSFEVGAVKPEPRIYEVACERLQALPAQCIFAGDGDCNELDGALAMGMVAIRVLGTESVALHLGGSDAQTHSVNGLSALTTLVLGLLTGSSQ